MVIRDWSLAARGDEDGEAAVAPVVDCANPKCDAVLSTGLHVCPSCQKEQGRVCVAGCGKWRRWSSYGRFVDREAVKEALGVERMAAMDSTLGSNTVNDLFHRHGAARKGECIRCATARLVDVARQSWRNASERKTARDVSGARLSAMERAIAQARLLRPTRRDVRVRAYSGQDWQPSIVYPKRTPVRGGAYLRMKARKDGKPGMDWAVLFNDDSLKYRGYNAKFAGQADSLQDALDAGYPILLERTEASAAGFWWLKA